MAKKIIQVEKRESIVEERVSLTKKNEKAAASYVVKSKYSALYEQLNLKHARPVSNDLPENEELKFPIVTKALQQKEKYVKKGGPCLTKREIGARY